MNRLLFEKTGLAAYISHLDLMRTFQRAFMRAGISIRHTEGFNPHAFISVALPLSVYQESRCELLDFGLLPGETTIEQVANKLNACLPEGLRVIKSYDSEKPFKKIAFMKCAIMLFYDSGVDDSLVAQLKTLYSGPPLVIMKKSKSGVKETDIRPSIKNISFTQAGENAIECLCTLTARDPILNPEAVVSAIETYLKGCTPDFYRISRLAVLGDGGDLFE